MAHSKLNDLEKEHMVILENLLAQLFLKDKPEITRLIVQGFITFEYA